MELITSVSSCLPVIDSGLYISLTTHKWKYLFSSSLSPLKHILALLCLWGTKACIVSWTAGTCERINGLLYCLGGGGGSHYLHPKAIFWKDVFSLSWLETSDPHGRICMDPYLKANQGTNTLPISPRWGLNCEQEAQMKDKKKERRDRWLTSVVNQYTRREQPMCQHWQITVHNTQAEGFQLSLIAENQMGLVLSML